METEPVKDVELVLASASWSIELDGICVEGRSPKGGLRATITRAGLAAIVGRDRCEVSAGRAWEIFGQHADRILAVVRREYELRPAAAILIDYAEVERG